MTFQIGQRTQKKSLHLKKFRMFISVHVANLRKQAFDSRPLCANVAVVVFENVVGQQVGVPRFEIGKYGFPRSHCGQVGNHLLPIYFRRKAGIGQ